ncbi:methyltransferase [Paraconexibacter algicola]|uniref:Methyltransferase n=1 Tax=Paraconexibacter algicola TaxID=2133960 RepID=A0A2T4UIC7_9ACTN|nr:methyltransferase [Paraconexibacter algicola]
MRDHPVRRVVAARGAGPASIRPVPAHPARIARSRAYRLYTRFPPALRARLEADGATGVPLALVQRLVDRGPVEVAAGAARGVLLDPRAFPLTHVQAHGAVRGTLEPEVQEALRRTVAPGDVVYDIGANVGFFTLLAARLTGPGGHVVAFEPSPPAVAGLRANVALNGLAVTVREAAVAATPGRARLLQVGEHSWSHLEDRGHHPGTTAVVEVEVTTVDAEVAAGRPVPAVVKLDVEGSEVAALQGMARTLAEHRPALVIELHGTNHEVLDVLDDAGYRAENLEGPQPLRDAGPVHLLARPAR